MRKYHYVYETYDPETGEYYIGKHSTDDLNDGYQGSGRWITECQTTGVGLRTRIISYYNSAKEAYKAEAALVTEDLLLDPYCMNRILGGY